ncbi:DUF2071 domain-containing protein [Microbacterium sp. 1P10UB]|uniref:DUF2071 domain-containing protein n=1 Tax=unclassified Microbacterium TaxID=2609290 RepID=UPI0039A0E89A
MPSLDPSDAAAADALTARDAPALVGRAVIEQRWRAACFLHWRVDPAVVAPLLPPGTRPDVFDGSAWVGLIPFVLSEFRFLPLPPVPLVGSFVEINVRTYGVDAAGRRSVVSRDDRELLATQIARDSSRGSPVRPSCPADGGVARLLIRSRAAASPRSVHLTRLRAATSPRSVHRGAPART